MRNLRNVEFTVSVKRSSGSDIDAGAGSRPPAAFSTGADQAVALRRRRLRDPVGALVDPVELAGLRLRARARCRAAAGARARRRDRHHARSTRPTRASRIKDIIAQIQRHDGFGMVGLVGVQSNQFPRALDIARPLRAGRHPGGDRRLPRLRLHRHAAGDAGRPARRRSTWAAPCSPAKRKRAASTRCCRTRPPARWQPIYNYMNDLPALEVDADAVPAAGNPASARSITTPASMPAAAVRSSARSAPSSTCRAASRAGARRTTSSS